MTPEKMMEMIRTSTARTLQTKHRVTPPVQQLPVLGLVPEIHVAAAVAALVAPALLVRSLRIYQKATVSRRGLSL
jgi:hypothetical protein